MLKNFVFVCDTDCTSSCGEDKFKCSNGCCVKKELECDEQQQCSDGSDEENCEQCETLTMHTHLMMYSMVLNVLLSSPF